MEHQYSNRELDRMFGEIQETLGRIETQTTRHNGRLSKIETWMYMVIGALTILSFLVGAKLLNFTELI